MFKDWERTCTSSVLLIRFQTKTKLFCSGYGYRPRYNAKSDHRKRSHLKTLFRVERSENDAFWKRCFLVWREKTMLSENGDIIRNRHDRAPDHSTLSIQNGEQTLPFGFNRPRSIYQYSNMAPRLSGQTSIFGVVSFVSKSLMGIEGQKKLEKFAILTRKPRSHAWILIYRTWPIPRQFRGLIYWNVHASSSFEHAHWGYKSVFKTDTALYCGRVKTMWKR